MLVNFDQPKKVLHFLNYLKTLFSQIWLKLFHAFSIHSRPLPSEKKTVLFWTIKLEYIFYVSSVRFMLQNIQKMQNRIDETFSETPAEMLNAHAKNASFLGCTSIFHRPHHREKKYNRFIFLNIICQFISCSLSLHYITKGLVVVHWH